MGNHIVDLEKYIVRIKEGMEVLGSGVLWKPEACKQNKIYIFTAAHVLINRENIEVEFCHHEKTVNLSVEKRSITISNTYHQEGDFGDVGIIILDYIYDDFPSYKFATFENGFNDIYQNKNLIMMGFPHEGALVQSYRLSRDQINFKYDDVDNDIWTFKYKIAPGENINTADRNSELVGFSGAGVFFDLESGLVLAGIHKGSNGYNAGRGTLLGTTSDFIRNMCRQNQYDIPPLMDEINGILSDQVKYFKEEIIEDLLCDDDVEKVLSLLGKVVGKDLAEAINGSFYNFCEECKYRTHYHQCSYFRGFLLILAVFLKAVNENVDLNSPQITEPEEIPIYFVCSEGLGRSTQAQLKMNHFIYALKSQKELAHRLEDNCIIIWGSEKQPRENQKKCTYSDYKKVLADITRMPGNALDITSLTLDPRPKAIIHIDEIISMFHNVRIKELHEMFAEYIGELQK